MERLCDSAFKILFNRCKSDLWFYMHCLAHVLKSLILIYINIIGDIRVNMSMIFRLVYV